MEFQVQKQGVSRYECVSEQTVEQPVDVELPLPEACADVARVLRCKATPRVTTKELRGRTLTLEGTITVQVLYCTADGGLSGFCAPVPFSRSIETDAVCDVGAVEVRGASEPLHCRPTGARRLDLHGAVRLRARLLCRRNAEIVTDAAGGELQLRRGTVAATLPVGLAEKHLIVEEELGIGQGQPAVEQLLRCDASARATDCRTVGGKAVVKGELQVCALYAAVGGGRPQLLESTLPFSQIVDVDGLDDGCDCDVTVEVASLEMKPRAGGDGSVRSFLLSCKLCASVSASRDGDLPVVYDAFSTRYEAELTRDEIALETRLCTVDESFQCKKTLEFSDGALGTVLDLWCEVQTGAARNEGNRLTVSGTVLVCLLLADADGHPSYQERPIDFTYNCELPASPENMRCDPRIEVVSPGFTLQGASAMEVRVELRFFAPVCDVRRLPLLTDLSVDEEAPRKTSADGALVIYYADAGEALWEIARRYNASPTAISELNTLSGETLEAPAALLIPVQ